MTLTMGQLAGFRRWGYDMRGWAQTTQYRYSMRVRHCANHVGDLTTATYQDLLGWLSSLPANANTRNSARSAIHAYYAWMQDVSLRTDNPADDLPRLKVPRQLPKPIDPTLTPAVLDAADRAGQRWSTFLHLMFHAALRVDETLRVQWADLTGPMLHVRGKGSKDRVVPLNTPTLQAVDQWRLMAPGSNWMFPSPKDPARRMSYSWAWQNVRDIGQAAGVDHLHPHRGRHTCASTLVTTGAHVRDIQELLGHSSLHTTTRYLASQPQQVAAAVSMLPAAYAS